jgi:hypothetical protein
LDVREVTRTGVPSRLDIACVAKKKKIRHPFRHFLQRDFAAFVVAETAGSFERAQIDKYRFLYHVRVISRNVNVTHFPKQNPDAQKVIVHKIFILSASSIPAAIREPTLLLRTIKEWHI